MLMMRCCWKREITFSATLRKLFLLSTTADEISYNKCNKSKIGSPKASYGKVKPILLFCHEK